MVLHEYVKFFFNLKIKGSRDMKIKILPKSNFTLHPKSLFLMMMLIVHLPPGMALSLSGALDKANVWGPMHYMLPIYRAFLFIQVH